MACKVTITFKHWNGETFTLEAEPTEYIDDLKEKADELYNIPVDHQRLTFNGKPVDDTLTLQEQNIGDKSTLVLEPMRICVVLPGGKKKIRMTAVPSDKIKRIKRAVSKKAGIQADILCVMFDKKELKDGQTMSECNIDHEDEVTVVTFAISVQHWDGDVAILANVNPKDTIEGVKRMIEETKKIPKDQQKFKFEGRLVNEFLSLRDQQIKLESLLEMENPEGTEKREKFTLSVFPTEPSTEEGSKGTITIKHWNGKTFTLDFDPTQYMEDLKEKIHELQNIPVDHQRLTFNGEPVDDTFTLQEESIEQNSTLVLEPMKICVMLPGGKKKFRMTVVPDDKIKRIKRVVAKKHGIHADAQRIMLGSEELKDGQTLSECNIDHEDVLTVATYAVSVKRWSGEVFVLSDINPNDTIEDVKQKLRETKNAPTDLQGKFKFDGRVLNEFLSLKDLHIKHQSLLEMEESEDKSEKPKKEKFKLSLFPTGRPFNPKPSNEEGSNETITIKHWNGTTFTLDFDPTQYIEDLKEKIHELQNIPVDHQRLTFDGGLLEDDQTLQEQNIVRASTLVLEPLKIHVVLPDGKKLKVTVNPDDTIKKVKWMVSKKTKFQVAEQCLMLGSEELKDGNKLSECNIDDGDVLDMEIFAISVAHWSGDIFVLSDVQPTDTIEDVKNFILKRAQIPKDQQGKYKFGGRVLNEFLSLKDLLIKHKSVLIMEGLRKDRKQPTRVSLQVTLNDFDSDDGSAFSDSSDASWLERAAHDEEYTHDLSRISVSDPDASWVSKVAIKELAAI